MREREAALLAAVQEDLDDVERRLVYADLLLEKGDLRGELIQVQCALEALAGTDPRRRALVLRERELLTRHGASWTAPLREVLARRGVQGAFGFHRGLVELAVLEASAFLAGAEDLYRLAPIRRVTLRGVLRPMAAALAASPLLERIEVLDVGGTLLEAAGLAALVASPHLRRLRALVLQRNLIGAEGGRILGGAQTLPALAILDVRHNALGLAGVQALAESHGLRQLKRLGISHNQVYPGAPASYMDWSGVSLGTDHGPEESVAQLKRRFAGWPGLEVF